MFVEARLELGQMQRRDIGIGHDGNARARKRCGNALPRRSEQMLADDNGVAPSGKLDLDDCLAPGLGQGGRAVAHVHTFL